MNKIFQTICLCLVLIISACTSESSTSTIVTDNTKYVNTFIGTGGHGHTFPGATTPNGMVQLSLIRELRDGTLVVDIIILTILFVDLVTPI